MAKNIVFRILSLALVLGLVAWMMISCARVDSSDGSTTDSGTNASETVQDETETKNTPDWEYHPGERPDETDGPTPADSFPVISTENPREEPADDTAEDIF